MRVKVFLALLCLALSAARASAQVPTGTISGRVSDSSGGVLPGVTVTATSPNLQGPRVVVTSEFGDYVIPLLPPGAYTITFDLSGFQTVTRQVDVASTEAVPLDAQLGIGGLEETIIVTGEARSFVQTVQTGTTIRASLLSNLPSSRTLTAAIALAPNVKATGPAGGTSGQDGSFSIAGAMAYDSVFLLNGVAITENLRGQPVNLFIEDAIQETTVSTSGISAEYGRFGGGLVNAITKSGGNQFSGSYRLGMNNDDWRAVTPFNETKLDTVVPTHEYTVGGPILKDTLWFFNAGRFQTQEQSFQTAVTNISYPRTQNEKRYEGKLTYTVWAGQVVKGSYTKIQQAITNQVFQSGMDTRSLYNQEQPQDLLSLNYNGVMGTKLFVEGQYSQRHLSFITSGAGATDLVNGTLLIDLSRGNAFRYWSPTFCVCNQDERDNSEMLGKATYFQSTGRRGTHTVVFGYNRYNDQRTAENHQSGSDYRIRGTSSIIRGETIYPVFLNNNSTFIQHDPITLASTGSDIRTHALFVNDSWRLNEGISINLGLRWDKNQGDDAAGNLVSNSSKLSHRLGIVWDPRRDGKWAINASTGRYVSAINNAIAETSPAGTSSTYSWFYQGPSINADPNGALVTPDVAIQQVFTWFNANGGSSRTFAEPPIVPGVSQKIGESLESPNSLEYAAGVTRVLGERGSVRADYVFRDYNDFYILRTDLTTGKVTDDLGRVYDLSLIENSNDLERRYQGGSFQASYRFGGGVEAGANYTLSRTWGNFDGENPASGPLTAQLFSYPEYREAEWNQAEGNLGVDQRHRTRIWGTYPRADGL